jgi:hypothetical protein
MTDKLKAPFVIPSRRVFLKGAALMGGSAAMLGAMNDGARAQGETIPVGQAAPLTDFAAADGVEFQNGLTLACEEINALGGILGRPLEPYFEDTKQMGDATNVQAVQRPDRPLRRPCGDQRLQHRLWRRDPGHHRRQRHHLCPLRYHDRPQQPDQIRPRALLRLVPGGSGGKLVWVGLSGLPEGA